MNAQTVVFWKRDFSVQHTPPPLIFRSGPYSWSVIGGPKKAEIYAYGQELDLWELLEYCRCPVQIFSDKGDAVWWGYVAEIKLEIGNWEVGLNIDSMANYIGVAYEDDADGGKPKKTAWAEDTVSTAEYGRKELLFTSSGSNSTHALAARDNYLAQKKYPLAVITPREKGENKATLYCRGWFDTLSWKYAPIPTNLSYGYEIIGDLEYSFGNNNAKEIAQGIWFSGDCNLASISVYVRKVGSPEDNLKVSLCVNTGETTPGDELTSGTVSGASLGTDFAWVNIPVSTYDFLDYDSYFIKLSRSGGQDVSNYYQVMLDDQIKYPLGNFVVLIGSNWDLGPDADMPFRLYSDDIIETTQQISTLVANYGQFISGININNQSGLYTASARDGNANAFYEITELLKMGTNNYRRILCEVTIGRQLSVYEEPAISYTFNHILKDGSLCDPYDTELRKEICPVGSWARFKDVIPANVDMTKLANPEIAFIDEAEYDPNSGQLSLTPRGFIDPFQIGRPKDG